MGALTSLSRSLMWDCTDSSLLTCSSHGSKKPEKGSLYEQNPSRLWCGLSGERPNFAREYECHYCCSRWSTPTHTTVCQPTIWTPVTPPRSSSSQCLWEYRRKRSPNWVLTDTHSLVLVSQWGVSTDLWITVDKWVSRWWGAPVTAFFFILFQH